MTTAPALRVCFLALILAFGDASAAPELVRRGDALDARNENAAALEVYLAALREDGESAELLRRIAKQHSQLIVDVRSRSEKKMHALESVRFAERAVEMDPDNAAARLSLAVCLGRLAELESPGRRIELARRVRKEAEAAARLDPGQDYAWHVLGRWHFEMATLNPALRVVAESVFGKFADATLDDAVKNFRKAIAAGPPRVVHHIELGRALLAAGETREGAEQIRKGLSLPSAEKEDDATKARGRAALRELEG